MQQRRAGALCPAERSGRELIPCCPSQRKPLFALPPWPLCRLRSEGPGPSVCAQVLAHTRCVMNGTCAAVDVAANSCGRKAAWEPLWLALPVRQSSRLPWTSPLVLQPRAAGRLLQQALPQLQPGSGSTADSGGGSAAGSRSRSSGGQQGREPRQRSQGGDQI